MLPSSTENPNSQQWCTLTRSLSVIVYRSFRLLKCLMTTCMCVCINRKTPLYTQAMLSAEGLSQISKALKDPLKKKIIAKVSLELVEVHCSVERRYRIAVFFIPPNRCTIRYSNFGTLASWENWNQHLRFKTEVPESTKIKNHSP